MTKIPFNVPPYVGSELEYVKQAVDAHKICGDGQFTKKCNEWMEQRFGAKKALLTTSGSTALDMAALLCDLQPGDEDLSQIPFDSIRDRYLVIEEKCDGANSAISFDTDGNLLLQSRGHYLTGGYRERHYNLMKQWANVHRDAFFDLLGTRYIMYGEWMYAKHTVFYDALPHYFLEFDIYDRQKDIFLDTHSRHAMLRNVPVVSVPVLGRGYYSTKEEMLQLLGQSRYVTGNQYRNLRDAAVRLGLDPDRNCRETELSGIMEGLYIKVEEDGQVVDRMKYVRSTFLQCVDVSETHWIDRPIIPNQLAVPTTELFQQS